MQKIEQGNYTKNQIIDVLHGRYGPRVVKYRYDLLSYDEKKIGEIDTVESGEVQMTKDAEIKRTGKYRILDKGDIDWLSDRIQPFYMLRMPDLNWVQWSLGIFLPSSPMRQDKRKNIYRDIEAYDGLIILKQDRLDYRPYFAKGTKYIDAVKSVLSGANIAKINIEDCQDTLQTDREDWNPGTDRLKIINDLLKEIVFTDLWVDEWGYYTAKKNITPDDRAEEYTYKDDGKSIILPGVEEEIDFFDTPNSWMVNVSNPELESALSSTYTNDNPNSLTSTVSRKRPISAEPETLNYISSQDALDEYVKLKAFKDSQIYGTTVFNSAVVPFHSFDDVLELDYSPLKIKDKYEEVGWTMPLQRGAKMRHEVRRVVQV